MRTILLSTAAAAVFVGFAGVTSVTALTTESNVPDRVSDFQLTDTTRLAHRLHYFKAAPAIVLMSQTDGSKLSRDAAGELAKLQAAYKDKGVLFYMINSSLSSSREQTATELAKAGVQVPVLKDDLQLVGEELNIRREGEVFVLSPKDGFRIAYHGPLDSRFAKASYNVNSKAKDAYTADAIDAVLSGKAVANPRVDVKAGKTLSFPERQKIAEHGKISYAKTVAPILQAKCVSCHQKGGIGPFAMNSYEIVKGFAPTIREAVMTQRMPPWGADPHVGSWSNDFNLTADEKKTLIHWIEAGAPRGTGEDILSTQAGEAPDWPAALGQPDVVVKLPSFNVPASGTVEYQMMTVDNPFKGDAWLRAVAFRPGARSVLHHITSSYSPDPKLPAAKLPGSSVGSYVPGAGIQIYNDGTGAPVPTGGKLRYSMHYTTSGKATTDATQIGYYTLKSTPEIIRRAAVISDSGLHIPAGEARHTEISYLEFPADAVLYSVHPHAHYRGYNVELTAKTPDGKIVPILSVPKYDFNWQLDYDLQEPMPIKAGTKLIVKWVYDNSAANAGNPDPKIDVKWGEQSWQEMMYFRVNYRWNDETSGNVRNDIQAKLMESRAIGSLDDDANGKITRNELRGNYAALQARFDELDLNKDASLDKKEFDAGAGSIIRGADRQRIRQAEADADAAL